MTVEKLVLNLVDQYRLEKLLVEKRYTDLFLAYDVDEDRTVTLDVLRVSEVESWFVTKFTSRARAIAQVHHPNIARIVSVGRTPSDQPFVAQTAIDGYPLSQRLEQFAARPGSVNTIYALKLVRQLADALLLATRLDLRHYDLRPQNILLKNVSLPTDDVLVLSDLFVPFERRVWPDDGTDGDRLEFLSPEQRAGKEIDATSHVYTLGVLAYHLLAAAPPPGPTASHEVLVRRLTAAGSSLTRVRTDLAPETYELIDRALRKDPRQRQNSIEEFSAELERALLAEELLVSAPRLPAAAPARRPWALLIATVLLALGAVATITGLQMVGARTAAAPTAALVSPETTGSPERGADGGAGGGSGAADGIGNTPVAAVAATGNTSPSAVGVGATSNPTTTLAASTTPAPTESPTPTATTTPSATAPPTAEPTQPPPTTQPSVRVLLNSIFLRRGPGTNYPQVGTLEEGDEVRVLARFGEGDSAWFQVGDEAGSIGWLSAEVVQLADGVVADTIPTASAIPATPTSTTTPSPTPSPTVAASTTPTPSDGGSVDPDATQEPPATDEPQPTEPPTIPTLTPPPFEP